ncbi:hypothetical protein TA3x_000524 [Tundrisphaera sp. TA3]|uniref:hypothetical protein n=1 Tax=Tundrisphaera sp. TA3 TaxID=3435775 RepID=UPI003EBEB3C4
MEIFLPVAEPVSESSTDVALIEAARKYSRAVEGHTTALKNRQRRLMDDFWRLGEALSYLYKRHNVSNTWMRCLKEIDVNPTTAGHARKFFERTAFENLDTWKCKTEALRDLGILAPPAEKPTPGPVVVSPRPVAITTPEAETWAVPHLDESGQGSRPGARQQLNIAPSEKPLVADAIEVPPVPPSPRDLLLKVVRALEEIRPVEANLVDLLDRAAALIEGLRAGAKEGVAV